MVEAREQLTAEAKPNLFWWLTTAYAVLAGLGWLTIAVSRFLQRRRYLAIAQGIAQTNVDQALEISRFAGSLVVDMLFAAGTAAVFAFVAAAVVRRTWNAWDYATVAIGFTTVFSLIMLCASGRVMFWIPFTSMPLLLLLYLPPTKAACGVQKDVEVAAPAEVPMTALTRDEIEREIAKERALITQLSQNLDVFEVERGMETDRFVSRYTEGLEEESADNAEWFSIARAVRRHRERLSALRAQLDSVAND